MLKHNIKKMSTKELQRPYFTVFHFCRLDNLATKEQNHFEPNLTI